MPADRSRYDSRASAATMRIASPASLSSRTSAQLTAARRLSSSERIRRRQRTSSGLVTASTGLFRETRVVLRVTALPRMHVVEALQGVVAQRLEHPVAGRCVVVLLGHDHGP